MREQADYLGKSHRKKCGHCQTSANPFGGTKMAQKPDFSRLWYASFLLVEGPFDKMVQIIC